MSSHGFVRNNGPQIISVIPVLNEPEQQAKRVGASISEYIGHINNGRSHREAIELAGGSLDMLDAELETGGWP